MQDRVLVELQRRRYPATVAELAGACGLNEKATLTMLRRLSDTRCAKRDALTGRWFALYGERALPPGVAPWNQEDSHD
jgi:DNA-binding IclR family transcriptional regulator